MSIDDYISIEMQVVGSISAVFSFFVVVTFLMFPKLKTFAYLRTVFWVAINDLIASIGAAMGSVEDGSTACTFQAFTRNYNYLVSMFLSIVVVYEINYIIKNNSSFPRSRRNKYFLFCWSFPLLITLLPLTMNRFGKETGDAITWCGYRPREGVMISSLGSKMWVLFSFYFWIWLVFIISAYLCINTYIKVSTVNLELYRSISGVSLFPIVVATCWTLISIVAMYIVYTTSDDDATMGNFPASQEFINAANILPCFQGFLLAYIMAFRSRMVRSIWYDYIKGNESGMEEKLSMAGASSLSISLHETLRNSLTMALVSGSSNSSSNNNNNTENNGDSNNSNFRSSNCSRNNSISVTDTIQHINRGSVSGRQSTTTNGRGSTASTYNVDTSYLATTKKWFASSETPRRPAGDTESKEKGADSLHNNPIHENKNRQSESAESGVASFFSSSSGDKRDGSFNSSFSGHSDAVAIVVDDMIETQQSRTSVGRTDINSSSYNYNNSFRSSKNPSTSNLLVDYGDELRQAAQLHIDDDL